MKVLITAAQFSPSMSGLQRHALNVVRCLLTQPEVSSVHFSAAPWQRELVQGLTREFSSQVSVHIAEMEQSLLDRNLWYYRRLPELVAKVKPDILHLSYPAPVRASAIGCPIVLTLHDLYPYEIPENFGFPRVVFNRLILQQCLRNVDAIACVSDTTLLRMRQYAPEEIWDRARRIYNCVEASPVCAWRSPLPGWQGEPFLLCVAQHRRNKNIPLAIRTLDRLLRRGEVNQRMKLVVLGITGPETDGIERLVEQLGLTEKVLFLQGISEAGLQWCYRRCEVVIAPSETEGFGLPVAEALLAGCRVVCSDIPAFREIDQRHCHFVALGPGMEERFAAAILRSLRQPVASPPALPQFSPGVLGRQYAALYRELLSSPAPARIPRDSVPLRTRSPEGQPL